LLYGTRFTPIECEPVIVPEVFDHARARQAYSTAWTLQLQSTFASIDLGIERIARLDVILQLVESFESPLRRRAHRQGAHHAANRLKLIRDEAKHSGCSEYADGRRQSFIPKQRQNTPDDARANRARSPPQAGDQGV
jgi:hypothetical protein